MTKEDFKRIFPDKNEDGSKEEELRAETIRKEREEAEEIERARRITEESLEKARRLSANTRSSSKNISFSNYFNNIRKSIFNKGTGLAALLFGVGTLSYFLFKQDYNTIPKKDAKPAVFRKIVNINGKVEYVDTLNGNKNLVSMIRNVYGLTRNKDVVEKVNEIVAYNAANNPDELVRSTITQDGEFVEGRFINYPKGYDGLRGDLIFKDRKYLFPNKIDTVIKLEVLVDDKNHVLDNNGNIISNSLDGYIQDEMEKNKMEYYRVEIKEISSLYNQSGFNKVKKMSGLENKEIYNALDLERKNGGIINYSSAFLSNSQDKEYLMNNIVNTYLNSRTNKEALATIEDKLGIKMSKTSLYRICDSYSKVIGYDEKIRKSYLKGSKTV